MNIWNSLTYDADYPRVIEFGSDTTLTSNSFVVENENFTLKGDGTATFTGTIKAEIEQKKFATLSHSGDKYELNILAGNDAAVGNDKLALADASITSVTGELKKLSLGDMVMESGSGISTKGT